MARSLTLLCCDFQLRASGWATFNMGHRPSDGLTWRKDPFAAELSLCEIVRHRLLLDLYLMEGCCRLGGVPEMCCLDGLSSCQLFRKVTRGASSHYNGVALELFDSILVVYVDPLHQKLLAIQLSLDYLCRGEIPYAFFDRKGPTVLRQVAVSQRVESEVPLAETNALQEAQIRPALHEALDVVDVSPASLLRCMDIRRYGPLMYFDLLH